MTSVTPMSVAQACHEIDEQLTIFEQRLTEKSLTLDKSDEEAWAEYHKELEIIQETREYLGEYRGDQVNI